MNKTDLSTHQKHCVDVWVSFASKKTSSCDCPLQCLETQYKTRVQTIPQKKEEKIQEEKTEEEEIFGVDMFEEELYYESRETIEWQIEIKNEDTKVTNIIQVPDYTLSDCLGAVGGILGLAIGASSLSLVELILYFVMHVIWKMY